MSNARTRCIRYVLPHERLDDLVDEAKGLTFEHFREHALLRLEEGRRVFAQGASYEMELEHVLDTDDPFGREGGLYVEVEDESVRVVELIFHTHPVPTGPSDEDMRVLRILKQETSLLFEIFGPVEGTRFRARKE